MQGFACAGIILRMSITSPDDRISTYNPVAPTTVFPANFPVFDNDDLVVIHNGVERDDFAVSATYVEGISTDAKAVFAVGITGAVQIVGAREPHRTNKFGSGPLPPRDLNLALDTVEAEVQELHRDMERAVLAAYGNEGQQLPEADPGKALGWSTGGALANLTIAPTGTVAFGNFGEAVAGMATATEFRDGFSFNVWDSGTFATLKDRMTRTYCVLDGPGSPDPTGNNDSTAALKAMIAEGVRCEITKGDFVTTEALLMKTPGQILFGHGGGYGYGNSDTALPNYVGHSRIIATGNGAARRVMTRRLMRTAFGDANDPAMIAVVDVEADGCQVNDLTIWLDCDYTNTSPSNLGANWDVGLFVGTRPGFQARNLQVLGYFRRAGIYLDVSNGVGYPDLLDYDGNPLDGLNPSAFAGGDGTHLWNPYVRGARIGLAVLGGLNDADADYLPFGGVLGGDVRGASGFSDFNVFGGRLYGPDHHSGQRLSDPAVVPLTQAGLIAEPDTGIAGALMIDGRCGNGGSTTHGIGCLRGMNFFNTRVSSFEKMRAYIRRADEVSFIGRGWSDTPLASPKNTAGITISSQDYVNSTYGHFTTHPTLTGHLHLDRASGGLAQTWVTNRDRLTISNAQGNTQVTNLVIRRSANSVEIGDAARVILPDDQAVSFPIPGGNQACVVSIMTANGADATAPRGFFLVRAGAAPVALQMASTANITFTTGALANGSGTDGNFTISTHTDGRLYFSNRAGASRTLTVQFLAPA